MHITTFKLSKLRKFTFKVFNEFLFHFICMFKLGMNAMPYFIDMFTFLFRVNNAY